MNRLSVWGKCDLKKSRGFFSPFSPNREPVQRLTKRSKGLGARGEGRGGKFDSMGLVED